MKPSSFDYNPRLDILRFFAATLVVLYHAVTWYVPPAYYQSFHPAKVPFIHGHAGVSLFLVMSGYLMCQIYEKYPDLSFKKFIYNRSVRILPLAIIFFIATISIYQSKVPPVDQFLNYATLMFSYDRAHQISPAWTIAVEFQFYLLTPLFIKILNKNGPISLVKFCSIIFILRVFSLLKAGQIGAFAYDTAYASLLGRIDQFLIGMCLFKLQHDNKVNLSNPIHLITSITLLVLLFYLSEKFNWWSNDLAHTAFKSIYLTLEGISFAYLMISFLHFSSNIPFEKTLASLGAASYSMYLWHEIVVRSTHHFISSTIGFDFIRMEVFAVFIAFPIVILISLLSFRWVEQPFLQMRRHYY